MSSGRYNDATAWNEMFIHSKCFALLHSSRLTPFNVSSCYIIRTRFICAYLAKRYFIYVTRIPYLHSLKALIITSHLNTTTPQYIYFLYIRGFNLQLQWNQLYNKKVNTTY